MRELWMMCDDAGVTNKLMAMNFDGSFEEKNTHAFESWNEFKRNSDIPLSFLT